METRFGSVRRLGFFFFFFIIQSEDMIPYKSVRNIARLTLLLDYHL